MHLDTQATPAPFSRAGVVLTTAADPRVAAVSDSACFHSQDEDGPTYLVIRPDATDGQLVRAAKRFSLDVAQLQAFRSQQTPR